MSAADFTRRSRSAKGIAENIGMVRTSSVVNIVRLAVPSVDREIERDLERKNRASQSDNAIVLRQKGSRGQMETRLANFSKRSRNFQLPATLHDVDTGGVRSIGH